MLMQTMEFIQSQGFDSFIKFFPYGLGGYAGGRVLLKGLPYFLQGRVKDLTTIDFEATHHTTVLGGTGSGKTYSASLSLSRSNKPVFFFNTLGTKSVTGKYTRAWGSNSWDQIEAVLRKKGKINFIASGYPEQRDKQLEYIVQKLLMKERDLIFAVDEVHLFANRQKVKAKDELIRYATTARNYGMKGVFLSQRPANVDNNLLEMSGKWVIFQLGDISANWFKTYGLPHEQILSTLNKSPKFSYLEYGNQKIVGPFRVK